MTTPDDTTPQNPRQDPPQHAPQAADPRRDQLLEAASQVFLRFGYRKSSMDELARAAGLSRQGLYLHFSSKADLFRAAIAWMLDRALSGARAALSDPTLSARDSIVAAFDAVDGPFVGGPAHGPHVAELLETSQRLVGSLVDDHQQAVVDLLALTLVQRGLVGALDGLDPRAQALTPDDLALTLVAVSHGLKHSLDDRQVYRQRLAQAVRLLCRPSASS